MADEDAPWIVSTQQALGGIIKRPKLTAALLGKPPFRFLHDIVSEVTRATGFADGLFEGDELQSGQIKEKELKISYLSKIIKCVEIATGSSIGVRPGKVVAGMEPENTNAFLVMLARAATSGVDNASTVARTLASVSAAAAPPSPAPLPPPEPPVAAPERERATAVAPGMQLADSSREAAAAEPERPPQQMRTAAPAKAEPAAEPAPGGYQRPSTARRRPPKLSSNEVKIEKPAGRVAVTASVMRDGEDGDEEETVLMVDREGEKVDTSSMKPVVDPAAHGKLVRNLLEAQQDLEQAAGERGGRKASGEGGIIIGKKKGEAASQSKTDITKLRSAIQTLCQSCNPLGRCLEYVHEDLEAMAKELEQWRAVRARRMAELVEEEAKTEASLFGLQQELAMAEQDVADKRAQIRFFKASMVTHSSSPALTSSPSSALRPSLAPLP
jgi:TRAF3-interacting protein 1